LTRAKTPKICLIPTAGGDNDEHIGGFYAACERLPCVPTHLSLFRSPAVDPRPLALAQDIIIGVAEKPMGAR